MMDVLLCVKKNPWGAPGNPGAGILLLQCNAHNEVSYYSCFREQLLLRQLEQPLGS